MSTNESIPHDATYDFGLPPGQTFDPDDLDDDEAFDLTQPHVMTVLGAVDPGALGFCLHHEHVIAKPLDVGTADPDLMLDDANLAVQELELFFSAGGRAVVDMTPADYGRDVAEITWVAQHAPAHIVVITGHHKDTHAAPYVGDEPADVIAARNIMEIRQGIGDTTVKAGVIKAGTSLNAITEVEERVLRAAARSHLATGAPISTHTDRGTMAMEQIAILREEGVDPARVVIGHLDFALDESYLRRIAETGAFISFDQWSKIKYATDEARAEMVQRLVAAGHAAQLLISGDLARKSYWLSYGGGPGFLHFLDHVPLLLMEAGLDAPAVRRIFIDNPARALTIR